MNWVAIGAIGEIVSVIVIVITLIYLARQVSYAKKSMQWQYHENVNALFNQSYNTVAASADLARAVHKAESSVELTPAEYVQVRAHVNTLLNGYEELFVHLDGELLSGELSEIISKEELEVMLVNYLSTGIYGQIWQDVKVALNPRFVSWVDTALQRNN